MQQSRLATDIKRFSYWQHGANGLLICLIIGVLIGSGMVWWVVLILAILLILTAVSVAIGYANKKVLLHITAPKQADYAQQWQLLYASRYRKTPELWEAVLAESYDYGLCIQLTFRVTHPLPKYKTIMLWRDQMPYDAWRQLKVISRWS